jgi:hypothetical protein
MVSLLVDLVGGQAKDLLGTGVNAKPTALAFVGLKG